MKLHSVPFVLIFFALFSLTSCYSVRHTAGNNNTNLEFDEGPSLAKDRITGTTQRSTGIQLSTFYGVGSNDKINFESVYKTGIAKDSINFETYGQIGIRVEQFFMPLKNLPLEVLSLGFEYSYSPLFLNYQWLNDFHGYNDPSNNIFGPMPAAFAPKLEEKSYTFHTHKFMVNCNYTFLMNRWHTAYSLLQVGYGTAILGDNFFDGTDKSPILKKQSVQNVDGFLYRAGLGMQFYITPRFAINGEVAYGTGTYFRCATSWWF